MWKKGEGEDVGSVEASSPRPVPSPASPERSARSAREAAIIGPSITIRGDVTGDEDLMIQGRIEGTVKLKQHNVAVGPEGKVDASIHARMVTVEGEVTGDLHGAEQVVLRKTARVQGNIQAPRVTLEDGARFRGGIDMGDAGSGADRAAAAKPEPAKVAQVPPSPKSVASGDGGK
jgi:cytoskeletal protein CcmA (bactofilin family)